MKENKILSNAEMIMEIQNFKESSKQLKEIFPTIAEVNKTMYDEMRKQGFSKSQAYDYTKSYTLGLFTRK